MSDVSDDQRLLTAADLAEIFGASEAKVMEWQRTYNWPRVKIGRTIRWTPEQVDQITRSHSITPTTVEPTDGRTALSARRAS